MKPFLVVKLSVDIIMTVLYLALMGIGLMKSNLHEVLGIVLFVLFVVHHLLNLNWYRSLCKGKWPAARKIQMIINILLLVVMVWIAISSVLVSRRIFSFNVGFHARKLHTGLVNWGFVLISIHIGFHWEMLMRISRKLIKGSHNSIWSLVLHCLAGLIAAYGLLAFIVHETGSKLIFYYGYSYWDFENKTVQFYVDYVCIMVLFIYLTHQGMKLIRLKL